MAGLVGYASSDEEDEIEQPTQIQKPDVKPTEATQQPAVEEKSKESESKSTLKPKEPSSTSDEPEASQIGPIRPPAPSAPIVGPSLPQAGDVAYTEDPVAGSDQREQQQQQPPPPPGSPYSSNRAILHDLTLPSIPNLDIPPSPPGSPSPLTDKKFAQFLDLKKKGVHFNAKLENSKALRNPSLMDKLMSFVELDETKAQYETTLPPDLWNPNGFPEWATREGLRKRQEKVAKEREAEKTRGGRTAVEFVPAAVAASSAANGAVAGGVSKGEKRKSEWK